jgi:DNA-binding PadR family transcriptional regulator
VSWSWQSYDGAMSSAAMTRMLVLGVVSIFEPANGYQIRRELLSWGVEQWADVKPGSIYSMLTTLARRGLLVRHDLPEGNRSVAVYATSNAGRTEFEQLVMAGLEGSDTLDRSVFKTALSFSPFLTRELVLRGLRRRLDRVAGAAAVLRDKVEVEASVRVIPPQVVHSLVLDLALAEAEQRWLSDFVALVEAGSMVFHGEPGGWMPPDDDSAWEMVDQSARYREQIAALLA